jgi:ribosomal-protein-serine acetyltransferase
VPGSDGLRIGIGLQLSDIASVLDENAMVAVLSPVEGETMFERAIETDLVLRMLRLEDAEELFRVVDANRLHLRQWLPWLDVNTEIEHTRTFIASTLDQHARNEGFVCAILLAGRIVGVVGYHPINWSNRSAEIGYWLSRDAVGRGLMTRCCRVLIDHAFTHLGLNRIAIPAAVGNLRSRAIPERLGFRKEGVVRDAEWLYDHYVDHVLYAALKREWDSEQGRCPGGESAAPPSH